MAAKIHQYSVGKENLYFFYRFVVLRWELEWSVEKFLTSEGDLRKYCEDSDVSLKSFESAKKLSDAVSAEYEAQSRQSKGLLWFVRRDTKPKDTLMYLRHSFAHGNFRKRQKNKVACIEICNVNKGVMKAKGFVPKEMLSNLVIAAVSCRVIDA